MTLTAKENLLRAIRHAGPEWVPNGMESVVRIASPVVERPSAAGWDAFGVHWSYEEGAEGGTFPAHGGHTVSELRRWREQVTIPDLDALDWAAVARQGTLASRGIRWHGAAPRLRVGKVDCIGLPGGVSNRPPAAPLQGP